MKQLIRSLAVIAGIVFCAFNGYSQSDAICADQGGLWLNADAVYGRVTLSGLGPDEKYPKITVTLLNRDQIAQSRTLDKTGNYCFKDVKGSGATLLVELEGNEAGREILSTSGPKQYRQDFDLLYSKGRSAKPGTVSAKYQYQRNAANAELLTKANLEMQQGRPDAGIAMMKTIVENDPKDFIVWSKLGAAYYEAKDVAQAEAAYLKAIEAKADLATAMTNLGGIYLSQNKIEPAIAILTKAINADRSSAKSFRLLGEAYLLAKQGRYGVIALNEAIRLDPVEMADGHLLMARLYEKAGAKQAAVDEYKKFLEKVPEHADKKKFTKFIKENDGAKQ